MNAKPDTNKLTAVELAKRMSKTRQVVSELLSGSGLHVRELTSELVVTNPGDPERGQVHIAFADGYVCWERVIWEYWGELAELNDQAEKVISIERIVKALKGG
jgi:hypothetical protein